jgi:tetratricopeptide (TPR) repeat protein
MLFNYGNTLNALGNYHEAIEQYQLSLKKDPNYAQCWKNMGTTYYNLSEHTLEIECYDKALFINPELPQALFSKGITLAQHFNKYGEALELFHRVLDRKNTITKEFINGLFWVAYCYEQMNDLTKALFWIDRGLSHEGTNPYFLNFKSNLLGRNWRHYPELKEKATEFFEYRIELENDSRSLYHFIIIKDYTLEQALRFLKDKSTIYKNICPDHLKAILFSLEDLLSTLLHLELYNEFRKQYPTSRYLNHLISPYFSIDANFFCILELVFGLAFNRAIMKYGESKDEVDIPKSLLETMLAYMPRIVQFLIPQEKYDSMAIGEIMLVNFQGYNNFIFREIGAQSGHITVNMGLRKIDPSEFIPEGYSDELGEKLYNIFVERLTGHKLE